MLTREAWNAFLKTLEEPPPSTVFVLATTEPHKVMATIVDRCQRFDFQRPAPEQIAVVVRRVAEAEGIEVDDAAVAAIARAAGGSFRDALGTLDQLVAYGGKSVRTEDVLAVLGVADTELILAAAEAIAAGDGRAALEASERVARSGHDPTQFGRDLLAHLRQLLVVRAVGDPGSAFAVTAVDGERMRAQAGAFSDLALTRAVDAIAAALAAVREGDEPRMTLELALLRAARPELDPTREALAQRLERLERALAGAAPVAAEPASPPDEEQSAAGEDLRAPEEPAGEDPGADPRPGPPAPAASATTTAIDALDVERLRELWPAVVEELRGQGAEVLSHVLEVARPLRIDAEQGVVEVGFPASAGFHKRKAEAPEARDRVTEAVRTIVGERLRPVYSLLDGEGEGDGTGPPQQLGEDELIARLREEFEAEEVSPEEAGEEANAKEAEEG